MAEQLYLFLCSLSPQITLPVSVWGCDLSTLKSNYYLCCILSLSVSHILYKLQELLNKLFFSSSHILYFSCGHCSVSGLWWRWLSVWQRHWTAVSHYGKFLSLQLYLLTLLLLSSVKPLLQPRLYGISYFNVIKHTTVQKSMK